MFAVIKMELSGKTVYGPALKTTQFSAQAQNHANRERCSKSFTIIFLGDHDIPLTGSNFVNLTALRAIFSHIFTAHAQKRPFMNFRLTLLCPRMGSKRPPPVVYHEFFLSYADTTDIFCVSVPKHQRHFLTYGVPLYPWQVRFVSSWNISDNTDKPTRSSMV